MFKKTVTHSKDGKGLQHGLVFVPTFCVYFYPQIPLSTPYSLAIQDVRVLDRYSLKEVVIEKKWIKGWVLFLLFGRRNLINVFKKIEKPPLHRLSKFLFLKMFLVKKILEFPLSPSSPSQLSSLKPLQDPSQADSPIFFEYCYR